MLFYFFNQLPAPLKPYGFSEQFCRLPVVLRASLKIYSNYVPYFLMGLHLIARPFSSLNFRAISV